ncbi:MAG: gliding motility protein GldL [Bacteroidales bacterium]|nr:gliding motility protein GldL [Bacteroidales bacterium]MCF8402686.1 gliding motility protein GldL [Bacteroidales bacterium]
MAKLYGIGAAVVILGALFKINHYQGADIMLVVGLTTESIIFFFSAFEPPHVEPDWSLVYPELAGMYHGVSAEIEDELGKKEGLTEDLDKMLNEAKIGPELIDSLGQGLRNLSENTNRLSDVTNATVATNEFTEKMKGASQNIGTLSDSYEKQSDTINKDIAASEEFYTSVKGASQSAASLSDVYAKATESIQGDLDATEGFAESVKAATQSANNLTKNYNKSAEILAESASALDFSSLKENNYNEQLNKISGNLATLNAAYEKQISFSQGQTESSGKLQETLEKFVSNLNSSIENTSKYQENLSAVNTAFQSQLQGTTAHVETTAKLKETLDGFLTKLNESTDKTLKYNEELDNLSKKVAALNTVYGNMLSAMNVKSDA